MQGCFAAMHFTFTCVDVHIPSQLQCLSVSKDCLHQQRNYYNASLRASERKRPHLHGAELGATHGAEVRSLGRLLGQSGVVEVACGHRVQRQIELVPPPELKARLAERIIPGLCMGVPLPHNAEFVSSAFNGTYWQDMAAICMTASFAEMHTRKQFC